MFACVSERVRERERQRDRERQSRGTGKQVVEIPLGGPGPPASTGRCKVKSAGSYPRSNSLGGVAVSAGRCAGGGVAAEAEGEGLGFRV